MVDFAHALRIPAVRHEVLGERDDVGDGCAEVRDQIVDLGSVGAATGHERGARGAAHRLLAIGAGEGDAAFGEGIDVWGDGSWRAEASDLGAQIIDRNEKDVGF